MDNLDTEESWGLTGSVSAADSAVTDSDFQTPGGAATPSQRAASDAGAGSLISGDLSEFDRPPVGSWERGSAPLSLRSWARSYSYPQRPPRRRWSGLQEPAWSSSPASSVSSDGAGYAGCWPLTVIGEEMADGGGEDAGRGRAAGSMQPIRHPSALGFYQREPRIRAEVMRCARRGPNVTSSPTFQEALQVVLTHVEGSSVPYLKVKAEEGRLKAAYDAQVGQGFRALDLDPGVQAVRQQLRQLRNAAAIWAATPSPAAGAPQPTPASTSSGATGGAAAGTGAQELQLEQALQARRLAALQSPRFEELRDGSLVADVIIQLVAPILGEPNANEMATAMQGEMPAPAGSSPVEWLARCKQLMSALHLARPFRDTRTHAAGLVQGIRRGAPEFYQAYQAQLEEAAGVASHDPVKAFDDTAAEVSRLWDQHELTCKRDRRVPVWRPQGGADGGARQTGAGSAGDASSSPAKRKDAKAKRKAKGGAAHAAEAPKPGPTAVAAAAAAPASGSAEEVEQRVMTAVLAQVNPQLQALTDATARLTAQLGTAMAALGAGPQQGPRPMGGGGRGPAMQGPPQQQPFPRSGAGPWRPPQGGAPPAAGQGPRALGPGHVPWCDLPQCASKPTRHTVDRCWVRYPELDPRNAMRGPPGAGQQSASHQAGQGHTAYDSSLWQYEQQQEDDYWPPQWSAHAAFAPVADSLVAGRQASAGPAAGEEGDQLPELGAFMAIRQQEWGASGAGCAQGAVATLGGQPVPRSFSAQPWVPAGAARPGGQPVVGFTPLIGRAPNAAAQRQRGPMLGPPAVPAAAPSGGRATAQGSAPAPTPAAYAARRPSIAYHRPGSVVLRWGGQEHAPERAMRDTGANLLLASRRYCEEVGLPYVPVADASIGCVGSERAPILGYLEPQVAIVLAPGQGAAEHVWVPPRIWVIEADAYDLLLGTPDCHARGMAGLDFLTGQLSYRPQ